MKIQHLEIAATFSGHAAYVWVFIHPFAVGMIALEEMRKWMIPHFITRFR